MTIVDRCTGCDGTVCYLEFMKSQVCTWCGMKYDISGKPVGTAPEKVGHKK